MIEPNPAVVRPRVVVPGLGPTLLEGEVLARLKRGGTGMIVLAGKRGSGRTTALAHLANLVGDDPRLVLFDGSPDAVINSARTKLVLCMAHINYAPREIWQLVPWSRDDCIEYLLAAHREECTSVMQRAESDSMQLDLPELWRPVLDRLAENESLTGVRSALRAEIESRLSNKRAIRTARECCFTIVCHPERENRQEVLLQSNRRISEHAFRFLRHEPVRWLLATDYLTDKLRSGVCKLLEEHLPEPLVRETAERIRDDVRVIDLLRRIMAVDHKRQQQPMAASLLHAAGATWVPTEGRAPKLSAAYLSGARWPGIRLEKLEINYADLTGADFSESRIQGVSAHRAVLAGANLHGAQLSCFRSDRANLTDADLSFARAPQANFCAACLRGATLEGALLQHADFTNADLTGARLSRANLLAARFVTAKLDEADFTGADLSYARLNRLPLKRANFAGALFDHAFLDHSDLEGMVLPGGSFIEADLQHALLTGSRIPDGQFRGAMLRGARLAEIEWEWADLRDADLSQCTFHLGSSRSGLVGSPIASEGSRTGFYTDEYHEQGFKAPEEIRKANLRGADLRGANINGTDFYLVDLRDARYTSEQEEHFRRCRAILETRV